jgi:hypothetical protein
VFGNVAVDTARDSPRLRIGLGLGPGPENALAFTGRKTECFFTETARGCDMGTLFNEETASYPGKYRCARPINRMSDSPHAVSNQRKGSLFPARPLNQPRGSNPGPLASEADALPPAVPRGRSAFTGE